MFGLSPSILRKSLFFNISRNFWSLRDTPWKFKHQLLIPPFHWPTLLWRSWRLWHFSKKAWSAVEVPRNVRFCGSWQYTTLFVCWYYAREDFAALILRPLCVSIAFVSRFLYNQGDQHALKVQPRHACCVRCTTGASSLRWWCTFTALMALCSKSATNCPIPSLIYWSSDVMDTFGHAAAIQIAVPQEDLLLREKKLRPKRFWVRAWLTDERRLQLYVN